MQLDTLTDTAALYALSLPRYATMAYDCGHSIRRQVQYLSGTGTAWCPVCKADRKTKKDAYRRYTVTHLDPCDVTCPSCKADMSRRTHLTRCPLYIEATELADNWTDTNALAL